MPGLCPPVQCYSPAYHAYLAVAGIECQSDSHPGSEPAAPAARHPTTGEYLPHPELPGAPTSLHPTAGEYLPHSVLSDDTSH